MNNENGKPNAKIGALKRAQKAAPLIAERYPKIADDYMSGSGYSDIVEMYHLDGEFGLTNKVAESAVSFALKMLMPEDELRTYAADHVQSGCKRAGEKTYSERKGAFGLNKKQLEKRARHSARERGFRYYTYSERTYLKELLEDPYYRHKSGSYKGRPDYKRIASAMRERFREKISLGALRIFGYRMMKREKSSIEPSV